MNEQRRLTDREVTDMLRRRSSSPVPVVLATTVLQSLAEERARHPARTMGRSAKRPLMLLAAAALLLAGGALAAGSGALRLSATVPPDPRSPFEGAWVSTSDADGGTQTMTVAVGSGDLVDVVVMDTVASVCAGSASTMTGAGSVAGDRMVIPSPDYRCDDDSEPHLLSGDTTPMNEFLRNLTYHRDPETDTLSVGNGDIWLREGARLPSMAPETPRTDAPTSGGMWPQSTLEEVRAAQERADAGDPAYTWQVGAQLVDREPYTQVDGEVVDRFLREAMGWESWEFQDGSVFSDYAGTANGWVEGSVSGQQYRRCAAAGPSPTAPGAPCAPTLDDGGYETVSVDLAQLARRGRDGIWVVTAWRSTAPFVDIDLNAAAADARRRVEAFLAARVAGSGAEQDVTIDSNRQLPLLYATTSGARYEGYTLERVAGPECAGCPTAFRVRLLAEGGATVVEQEVIADQGNPLWVKEETTTENGQPVSMSHTSPDGSVSIMAPATWRAWLPGRLTESRAHVVWYGALWRAGDLSFAGEGDQIELTDPIAFDAWCATQGGSPLLSGPADAAAIAQLVIADPRFRTTAPATTRIGGLDAVAMDVTLAPGGDTCGAFGIEISRWVHGVEAGERLRLYLVDLPEGMPVRTLAVTIVSTEATFDEVIAETSPIIESIEFHPNGSTTSPSVAP